jgi:hypothetical protein
MKLLKILLPVIMVAIAFPQEKEPIAQDSVTTGMSLLKLHSDISGFESITPYVNNIQYEPLNKEIDYTMLTGISAATLGAGILVHIYQRDAWWTSQRRSFHIQNDPSYALNIDKAGHFFGAAFLAHVFSGSLEATNMQSEQAAIWGSSLAFAFQLYVEVEDGFGPQWGFSPGDATADFFGASYTLAQYYFPVLKNFLIKFSYYPSLEMREGRHKGNAIDDYQGQKYWMSVRVRNFMPEKAAKIWPEWLNIAFGAAAQGLDGSGGGRRVYYLGLDLDTEAIPLYGPIWQFVKNTFNYVHFPMPGIRFGKDSAAFVFLF